MFGGGFLSWSRDMDGSDGGGYDVDDRCMSSSVCWVFG